MILDKTALNEFDDFKTSINIEDRNSGITIHFHFSPEIHAFQIFEMNNIMVYA
jgi:hypothetical protein